MKQEGFCRYSLDAKGGVCVTLILCFFGVRWRAGCAGWAMPHRAEMQHIALRYLALPLVTRSNVSKRYTSLLEGLAFGRCFVVKYVLPIGTVSAGMVGLMN